MFLLKTVVTIVFLNASTPPQYTDAVTISFASRAECEAKSTWYGQRVAKAVAAELKLSKARATVAGVKNKCEPIGWPI
jgi:hypothetical protein